MSNEITPYEIHVPIENILFYEDVDICEKTHLLITRKPTALTTGRITNRRANYMRIEITESNGQWYNTVLIDEVDAMNYLRTGAFMCALVYCEGDYYNNAGEARIIGEPIELCALAQKVMGHHLPIYIELAGNNLKI